MKTHGTMELKQTVTGPWWVITAQPYCMIKLKAIFGKIDKVSFGTVKIAHGNKSEARRMKKLWSKSTPAQKQHAKNVMAQAVNQ